MIFSSSLFEILRTKKHCQKFRHLFFDLIVWKQKRRNHYISIHRAYWTLKYSWLCSLILWFLCFFSLYITFNYIYKNLVQSLWWKHGHIAAIVIWVRSGENQLGTSLFTDILHQLSADLSTQYLQNREIVDIFCSKKKEILI